MTKHENIAELEVGYDIPAAIGMADDGHPDPLPDPRPRRARAQHQEDGRLRPRARHAPPRPRQDAQVGRRAEAAGEARRRRRRLLPEGLRGRGLRPRRHQGHPGLERGPRPGQDRPRSPACRSTGGRDHRLRRRRGERRRPLGGGRRSTAPPSSASSRSTAAPAAAASPPREAVVEIAKAIAAAPGLRVHRHPGLPGRDAAPRRLRGPQGQARRRHRPGEGRGRRAQGRGPRARARLRRRHRQLLFREQLRRLQRAAVRQLRLHGRRLRPHQGQGRQPHRPRRVGERALHPDQRDEPRQAASRGLRRRPQGAVGRQRASPSSTAATT